MNGDRTRCVLCGSSVGIAVAMIRWIERPDTDGPAFTAAPRCVDRAACRHRVELAGEAWDVRDAAPREAFR